jgi:hypothetical protein
VCPKLTPYTFHWHSSIGESNRTIDDTHFLVSDRPGLNQTDATLVRREATSIGPANDGLRAAAAMAVAGRTADGARPDSTTRRGRAATYGIDQRAGAATAASAHCIGTEATGC